MLLINNINANNWNKEIKHTIFTIFINDYLCKEYLFFTQRKSNNSNFTILIAGSKKYLIRGGY